VGNQTKLLISFVLIRFFLGFDTILFWIRYNFIFLNGVESHQITLDKSYLIVLKCTNRNPFHLWRLQVVAASKVLCLGNLKISSVWSVCERKKMASCSFLEDSRICSSELNSHFVPEPEALGALRGGSGLLARRASARSAFSCCLYGSNTSGSRKSKWRLKSPVGRPGLSLHQSSA